MWHIERRRLVLAAAFAITSLSSCATDYPQIATLSSSMQKSATTWQTFADDYATTCRRRSWWDTRIGTSQDPCRSLEDTQKILTANIAALNAYFGAVSAISNDSNYSLDAGLQSAIDGAAATGLDGDKVKAAGGIAKLVAGWVAAGIRHRSLKEAAGHAPDAIAVVDALKDVMETYRSRLQMEGNLWTGDILSAQSSANALAKKINGDTAPQMTDPPRCDGKKAVTWTSPDPQMATADQLLLRQYYLERCNAIISRIVAVDKFDISAEAVKESLKKLETSDFNKKDLDALNDFAKQAKDIFEKAEAVKKAFAATAAAASGSAGA